MAIKNESFNYNALSPRQNMPAPFLTAVKHAENERLFAGVVDEIGDDPRMPEKANSQAWQDVVSRRREMRLVGDRRQSLIRTIRGLQGGVIARILGNEAHHADNVLFIGWVEAKAIGHG
jgi:hypothetical protein